MKKKLLTLLLLSALTVSVLGGCGSKKENSTRADSATVATDESTGADSTETTDDTTDTPEPTAAPTPVPTPVPFPYELHVMYYDSMGYPYYYYIGLNALYISPEDNAKNLACVKAQSNYVYEHFSREDGCCSLSTYWGPVGETPDGKPIYVQFISVCNDVSLGSAESRGIYTAGMGY